MDFRHPRILKGASGFKNSQQRVWRRIRSQSWEDKTQSSAKVKRGRVDSQSKSYSELTASGWKGRLLGDSTYQSLRVGGACPIGLAEFNWVELFTFIWLMDEIQVLPRCLPKAGKTKPNKPDSTSRPVESLAVAAHPSWDNHLRKENF